MIVTPSCVYAMAQLETREMWRAGALLYAKTRVYNTIILFD